MVVTKLDRLGPNTIDFNMTVKMLGNMGICVHCLTLGGSDLTNSARRMIMNVINPVAKFERDLLIERTQSEMDLARAHG